LFGIDDAGDGRPLTVVGAPYEKNPGAIDDDSGDTGHPQRCVADLFAQCEHEVWRGHAGHRTGRAFARDYSVSVSRTTVASSLATPSAVSREVASTMTRTTGSVPDGRSSTRPFSPRCCSAEITASTSRGSTAVRVLSTPSTLIRTCGNRVIAPARS